VDDADGDRSVLTIDLDRNPDAPALARAAINGFCEDRNLSASMVATLTLLVSEVVTNAVIHPDTKPLETITMRASVEHDTVRVEVSDPGRRFTPRPRDPDRVDGGYGLYLVESEAARWGGGAGPTTTVWFEVAGRSV
jgi:anti-sigma regulatory factor (Ser/Thr protein kinase)